MAELNEAQSAAVAHGDGPLLILAGAGSGKTRVITHRIAALVRRGVDPSRILAVSFTNKAAEEMSERMVPLVGRDAAGKLWMSTFHSFGLRFVKEERKALQLASRFVVFDQGDALGVIKQILRELYRSGAARKLDPAAIGARISSWKSAVIAADAVPESDFEYDDVARDVYPEYEARLRAMSALDFDDLCTLPVRAMQATPELRERWRQRFDHVLVDEFQDTSRVQLELVRLLANERGNVCVVGDDDQSIYGWRGADVGNILDFDRHFRGALLVKLEQNYRSCAPVLAVANAVIAQSRSRRHEKTLRATRRGGDKVRLCVCEDPTDEAKLVAREVRDLYKSGRRCGSIAVLYRSNLQARALEEELRGQGIAYRLFGGQQFFDRKEVKDAAAYMRALINPADEISLRRIINQPPRGLGSKTVERLSAHAERHRLSFAQAVADAANIEGLGDSVRASAERFHALLVKHRQLSSQGQGIAAVARSLLEGAGLRSELTDTGDAGGPMRWANVEHFLGWLERFEREQKPDKRSLQAFLERVTLGQNQNQQDGPAEAVTLSTLHGVKGLEFDVVFLIGCVEGQLPHSRTTDPKVTAVSPADLEEERRLFYVGITRARERLYLCRFRRRQFRGRTLEAVPSRFLEGLPEAELEVYARPEKQELAFDEIAELGRKFLESRGATR